MHKTISLFCLSVALLWALPVHAQEEMDPDYLLHVTTVNVDNGYIKEECISVYPDGNFLVGKGSAVLDGKTRPKLKVKAGKLPPDLLQQLQGILQEPTLAKLGQHRSSVEGTSVTFTEAEDVYVAIPRTTEVQRLHFFTMFGVPSEYNNALQHPGPATSEGYTVEEEKKIAKPLLEFVRKKVAKAKGMNDTDASVSCETFVHQVD
jgi:hypothetical protein